MVLTEDGQTQVLSEHDKELLDSHRMIYACDECGEGMFHLMPQFCWTDVDRILSN